jgi:hypothetical protein
MRKLGEVFDIAGYLLLVLATGNQQLATAFSII